MGKETGQKNSRQGEELKLRKDVVDAFTDIQFKGNSAAVIIIDE